MMIYDLLPARFFQQPSWISDDDDWLTNNVNSTGLTVSSDNNNVYVEAAVPGIKPENIEVTFDKGYLWIRGENKEEEKDAKRKYYHKATRSFSYRVAVPEDINHDKEPEAAVKNGIMTVIFPKSPKAQPKKIAVKNVEK